ncbi:MAG: aspartate:alanine exchanger family transporter [Planctomycetaceae bacterium]
MNEVARGLVALCLVIAFGLALGKISWKEMSLGSSGVIFSAILAGQLGLQIPQAVGLVGVVLFVYCLGIGAGPSFLSMFLQRGKSLAILAAVMIGVAGLTALGVARGLHLTPDLTCGLLAGALTSTPALAAAAERLPAHSEVAVGFGVAYPFGVVGVILFVQLLPRLFPGWRFSAAHTGQPLAATITRELIRVLNPAVVGKRLRDVGAINHSDCQITRVLSNGAMQPVPADFHLELGQLLLAVGSRQRMADVVEVLGETCSTVTYQLDTERQRRRIVATSPEILGQSLRELHLLSRFGVTIARILRQEVEFVPRADEIIQYGDALTAVGEPKMLDKFVEFAGHRERTLDETDLISLSLGIALGVMLGRLNVSFGGESLSLGLAGGPLVAGLFIGHCGRIGPFQIRLPRAGRNLLAEIGLALFLAQSGTQAGGQLLSVIAQHGLALCGAAVVITAAPLVAGAILARWGLRLDPLETAGGLCGAMTSTPGLGAATSNTDSNVPATSYAAVYPIALILVTAITPFLLVIMSR